MKRQLVVLTAALVGCMSTVPSYERTSQESQVRTLRDDVAALTSRVQYFHAADEGRSVAPIESKLTEMYRAIHMLDNHIRHDEVRYYDLLHRLDSTIADINSRLYSLEAQKRR